jgi:hypothetical protein
MATFDVVLTNGPRDWLVAVEAGSNREAAQQALLNIPAYKGVTVKKIIKTAANPRRTIATVPEHMVEYIEGLKGA